MAEKTRFSPPVESAPEIPVRSCLKCAYHFVNKINETEFNECRFSPPVMFQVPVKNALGQNAMVNATAFPIVAAHHWCWQFNPKNKALTA